MECITLSVREGAPEANYEPWGKSQQQADGGCRWVGGQHVPGKGTARTKSRSKRSEIW